MLYIVSNISSKTHAGKAFFRVDKKPCIIKNDIITIKKQGLVQIEIGYHYSSGKDGELLHFVDNIENKNGDIYMEYKVPVLLSGKGKMRTISKMQYYIKKKYRELLQNPVIMILIGVIILIIYAILI
mgnify:CR=1 FL=1